MASSSPRMVISLMGRPVIDVGGDHQHDRRRGDAHQEGEVADVEAPGDLVPHVGDDEAVAQLPGVGEDAQGDEEQEEADPGVVEPAAP